MRPQLVYTSYCRIQPSNAIHPHTLSTTNCSRSCRERLITRNVQKYLVSLYTEVALFCIVQHTPKVSPLYTPVGTHEQNETHLFGSPGSRASKSACAFWYRPISAWRSSFICSYTSARRKGVNKSGARNSRPYIIVIPPVCLRFVGPPPTVIAVFVLWVCLSSDRGSERSDDMLKIA